MTETFIAFIKGSTSCFLLLWFCQRLGQRFPPWTQSSTRRGSMISSLPFCPSPRQLCWVHRDEEGRQRRGVVHSLACSATGGHPYSSYNHHSFTFWFSSIRSLFLWDHETNGKGHSYTRLFTAFLCTTKQIFYHLKHYFYVRDMFILYGMLFIPYLDYMK